MKKLLSVTLIYLVGFLFIIACRSNQKILMEVRVQDGYYDSEYPVQPLSGMLENILPSVKMISGITSYRVYQFDLEDNVTLNNVKVAIQYIREENTYLIDRPNYGTGAVVYNDGSRMALLTCAHVVCEPDTQVTYFADAEGKKTEFIHSINYKIDQRYTVVGYSYPHELDIVALDIKNDLALVSGKINKAFTPAKAPVLRAKWGDASAMRWGSLVYIIGFPNGKKMINQALVNKVNESAGQTFLVDKAMNRGISGSIVLAIMDGIPNLEIVGLIKAVPVKRQVILLPERLIEGNLVKLNKAYEGNIYVGIHSTSVPGMSVAVGIDAIKSFLKNSAADQKAHDVFINITED